MFMLKEEQRLVPKFILSSLDTRLLWIFLTVASSTVMDGLCSL